jgi:uncharacterized protein DUF3768
MSTYDTGDELLAEKRRQIRALNDALRTGPLPASLTFGRIVVTRGVADRGSQFVNRAVRAVREFSEFTENNDPHGEHDFGIFELDGVTLYWKIDYYDEDLEFGSPDPADPAVTCRVLTILLREEY